MMPDVEECHQRLDRLLALHEAHIAELHTMSPSEIAGLVAEHKQMLTDHRKMVTMIGENQIELSTRAPKIDLLVDLVAGEMKVDPYTGIETGIRNPGIAERMEQLEHRANGGGGVSMRTRDKLLIVAATGLINIMVAALAVVAAIARGG